MKIINIILLIPLVAFNSSDDCIFINKGIYQVCYSESYRSPIKVTYKLYKPQSIVKRKGSFYKEDGIETASDSDFRDNNFDKGHMAPVEAFSDSEEHVRETFSYVNCTLQHYKLNRGVWKILESKERKWAEDDSLLITCNIIFDKGFKKLPSGTCVPSRFRKSIVFLTTHKELIFEFPNEKCTKVIDKYIIND